MFGAFRRQCCGAGIPAVRCVLRILRRSARNKWKTFWSLRDEARDWAFFASRAERCHYLAAAWGQLSPDDRRRFLRRAM